jgi:hypothetical protein
MTATAEVFGDLGYIELAFAADAEAELTGIGYFAEKDCSFNIRDADEVIDDAFAVLGVGTGAVHVLVGDPGPGNRAFALEIREGRGKQADLAGWV